MIGKQRSGVFLSYARKDGEEFAAMLRERLRDKAPDIVIKQDRLVLEGGVGWWKQLTKAIDSVEFLVLVMTPSSMQSETVRKEWRYARQQGVCVYPVKGAPDLKFSELPRWMSKSHFFDLEKEWESFVAHLRKGCDRARVPFMSPDLPENFVQRAEEFGRLKAMLLSPDRKEPIAITTALSGAGGFGKTTLAAAVCHDEDIIQNFDDGIVWITLGQNPNVLGCLGTAYAALTGERPGFLNEEDAIFQLGQKLEDRTCLLVIDDVWDESHLRPFLGGGRTCAKLFTTRIAEIASTAQPVNVDEMSGLESVALIGKAVPGIESHLAHDLSQRLGEWPIDLELACAMMRQRIDQGDSAEHAAQRLCETLDRKGPGGLAKGTGDPRHRTIDGVLEGSLELLHSEDRTRLKQLSIFKNDIPIPLDAAGSLWGLDGFESEETAQKFARLSLLKLDLSRGTMRLHDVLRSWLVAATPDATELHGRLVDTWPDRMQLPHSYAWRWLTWHLARAGRQAEVQGLLWNPAWLQAKVAATDVNALIGDFEHLDPDAEAELVRGALRLSSQVLARDSSQFASQIVGRLLPQATRSSIYRFIESLKQAAVRPWLRPLQPALDPPGTALLRTLIGHSSVVNCVAITADGRRAVSASDDNTLKVWDLETGEELRTLIGHSDSIFGVAITGYGRLAVSASSDQKLKVWDLETGGELRTLTGHSRAVISVAATQDGRLAISACGDKTLKLWDLATGTEVGSLVGHTKGVLSVAISIDGRLAVSASQDETVRVWDIAKGAEVRMLAGHSDSVIGVAVSADGRVAASASRDRSIKVWNLETGTELRTLDGHSDFVNGVALSADGRRAISASWDKTLKVWDVETGVESRTLVGHSKGVYGVALSTDGRRAVSVSDDNTLKVWDLEAGGESGSLAVHSKMIVAIALSSDGRRAVSASRDKTLKVWDLDTGHAIHTLVGHSGSVDGVAVSADGRVAISASGDHTIKVWDLDTGAELRTLVGHPKGVYGAAISHDGRLAVSASSDHTVWVWNLETGQPLRVLAGHSDSVFDVALSADGRRAVSASDDYTLKVWNVETGVEERTLASHSDWVNSVALNADGRRAVSASRDKTLKLWDIETGAELHTFVGHSAPVSDVAISADQRRFVSSSDDRTLRVWDMESGNAIAIFTCDSAPQCCAFMSNRIVAGDAAGRVHFLSLEL
jgi:WD40 repeat protein